MKASFHFVLVVAAAWLMPGAFAANGQSRQQNPDPLTESGKISIGGQSTPYLIHRLPVSSFPEIPMGIQSALNRRGCMIPQTYEAHRPENVVHASLERSGSSDWAVLCSAQGTVSLLVFFAGAGRQVGGGQPMVLASALETQRLQAHGAGGVLGFNWGIDPATPQQVHEAQAGVTPRPPYLDHDALADSTVDQQTLYHFYGKGGWTMVEMPE